MIKVALQGAEFFAYHGFYAGEQILGNTFTVDIEVLFEIDSAFSDDKISNTVNYEELYAILQTEMQHTRKLIETVAQAIINKVSSQYPYIISASVTISKAHPFIGGRVKKSVITMSYIYNSHI